MRAGTSRNYGQVPRPRSSIPWAIIWDEVLHEIIGAMMRLANDGAPLHVNVREEMILELAKIQLYVGEQIVHKRLAGRDPATVEPAQERIDCFGDAGWASINDTAREFYNQHWRERLETRWIPKSAAAAERENNPKPRRLAVKRVDKNHFISRWFIRDLWATDGKIMRWRRTDEGWTSARRGFARQDDGPQRHGGKVLDMTPFEDSGLSLAGYVARYHDES